MKLWTLVIWICFSSTLSLWPVVYDWNQRRLAKKLIASLHGERITLDFVITVEKKGKPLVFMLVLMRELLRQDEIRFKAQRSKEFQS
jgi:hypothetical protein